MKALHLNDSEQQTSDLLPKAGLSDTEAAVYTLMLGRGYCGPGERLIDDLEYFFPSQRARRKLIREALDALAKRNLLSAGSRLNDTSNDTTYEVIQPWADAVDRSLPEIDQATLEAIAALERIVESAWRTRVPPSELRPDSQMLVKAVGPANSEAGRQQLGEFIRCATQEIRLGVYSSKTVYPEIKDLIYEKLLNGDVHVRILMLSPDVAASIEGDNQLIEDVLLRTKNWRALVDDVQRQRKKRTVNFELRWLEDANFAALARVMLVDKRKWMLTVHRTGPQRGIEGFVHIGTGERGETNLYRILDFYWSSAWKRAVNPFDKTRVFIGSSSEGLPVARALGSMLEDTGIARVTVWDKHFKAGRFTLEDLLRAAEESQFAVLVMTADGENFERDIKTDVPRDNVVFELGMFITSLGLDRAMLLCEETESTAIASLRLKLPTDVAGLATLKFRPPQIHTAPEFRAALTEACKEIEQRIRNCRGYFPDVAGKMADSKTKSDLGPQHRADRGNSRTRLQGRQPQ